MTGGRGKKSHHGKLSEDGMCQLCRNNVPRNLKNPRGLLYEMTELTSRTRKALVQG